MSAAMVADLRAAIRGLAAQGIGPADPASGEALLALLRALHATGRADLPLGRLLEGHVDAVQIVHRYGDAGQRARLDAAIRDGAMLGVWNAALPGAPLTLDGDTLSGGKAYASGAGVLTHALVTADGGAGAQLLLLPLDRVAPAIDRDWWRVTGMQRSETHLVRWDAARIAPGDRVGAPGDYAREPGFSGGALRFVAVQAGGVAALLDRTRDHLRGAVRTDDPFQAARLASLYLLASGAAEAVHGVARGWFATPDATRLAQVAAARLAVLDAAERALTIAREAVGLPGLFVAHPLAATLSDLAVYLRQPGPDAQRLRVGRAVADGALDVAL